MICTFLQETVGEQRDGPVWNSNGPRADTN